MIYLDKLRNKVCIEVFTGIAEVRERLRVAGFEAREADVLSNGFWGVRFVIDRPTGKGATARIAIPIRGGGAMNPYRILSLWRDLRAARKGPPALAKRLVRRKIYGRAMRAAGLLSRLIGVQK